MAVAPVAARAQAHALTRARDARPNLCDHLHGEERLGGDVAAHDILVDAPPHVKALLLV